MGDRNRITKDFCDGTFMRLLHDMDTRKVKHNLSPFYTRPAYDRTKSAVGGIDDGIPNLRRTH